MTAINQFSPRLRDKATLVLGPAATAALAVALFIRSTLAFRAETVTTASNVLSAEPVFRLGFVANLIGAGFYGVLTLVLHYAVAPAKLSLSLVAGYFALLRHTASEAGLLIHLVPAILHESASALAHFASIM